LGPESAFERRFQALKLWVTKRGRGWKVQGFEDNTARLVDYGVKFFALGLIGKL
jgi:hypothetical protein